MGRGRGVVTIPEIPEEGLMGTQLGTTPPWALIRARESMELFLQDKHVLHPGTVEERAA